MGRRKAWLHIDLARLEGDTLTDTLLAHRDALREQGYKTPVHSPDEGRRAWLEMLRLHRDHGLRRREVEGAWAEISRRAWKGRKVPLLSVPGFGSADPEQVDLILDILHGLALHVVVTVPVATTPERADALEVALAPWEARLKPGRVHRVHVAPGDWAGTWREYAALAGVDATALPLVGGAVSEAARRPRPRSAR